jgi:hypothetical protein
VITRAAKSLKNGKAGGPDGILNEMLKISFIYSTTAYVNLFNTILKSGIYPELWRGNYIKPIFKDGCGDILELGSLFTFTFSLSTYHFLRIRWL